jgi:predicted dehydrogenase
VGVSVFGGHEDVANARVEFEDGCVANFSASRASYVAARKMRLWGAEGYATIDFATRHGTLVQPSEQLRQGHVDLAGVDLSQPAAVKEHIFGKILRVDQVQTQGAEPLALELEDFVRAVREKSRPRVSGEDALRAMRLADQVLREIRTHKWEGVPAGAHPQLAPPLRTDGPTEPSAEPRSAFRGPISWRNARPRQSTPPNR